MMLSAFWDGFFWAFFVGFVFGVVFGVVGLAFAADFRNGGE